MSKVDEVISGKAQLLDVRTEGEWQAGHADYAILVPLEELLRGKTEGLHPSEKIYIYCRSGARARVAAAFLQSRGFDAENVGGLGDWIREGGTLSRF